MTYITSSTGVQRSRWREQASKIAHALKLGQGPLPREDGLLHIGVAFDDGMVGIKLDPAVLAAMSRAQLAEHLYQLVLDEAAKPDGVTPLEAIVPELGQRRGTLQ